MRQDAFDVGRGDARRARQTHYFFPVRLAPLNRTAESLVALLAAGTENVEIARLDRLVGIRVENRPVHIPYCGHKTPADVVRIDELRVRFPFGDVFVVLDAHDKSSSFAGEFFSPAEEFDVTPVQEIEAADGKDGHFAISFSMRSATSLAAQPFSQHPFEARNRSLSSAYVAESKVLIAFSRASTLWATGKGVSDSG